MRWSHEEFDKACNMVFRQPLCRDQNIYLGTLGIALVAIFTFSLWSPLEYDFYPKCWFFQSTGIFCPGCGSQRAFHYLLRGNILLALHHNLLIFLALPLLGIAFAQRTQAVWFRHSPPHRQPHPNFLWFILLLTILYWLLRNIPIYPLTLLAPPPLTPPT